MDAAASANLLARTTGLELNGALAVAALSIAGVTYPLRPGRWYSTYSTGHYTGDALGADGVLSLAPVLVSSPTVFDSIAVEVASGGSAGALLRLGIYADNGEGLPGNLLLDAGTIDVTSPGQKTLDIELEVFAGVIWIGAASQGAPDTRAGLRLFECVRGGINGQTVPGIASSIGCNMTGVTGALPATFSLSLNGWDTPAVFVRAA